MFEDSLMESQNRLSSSNQRWTAVASLSLQCALAAALVAVPLLHPDVLPFRADTPTISLPVRPFPPPVPHVDTRTAPGAPSETAAPSASGTHALNLSHLPSLDSAHSDIGDPPLTGAIGPMIGSGSFPGGLGPDTASSGIKVSLAPSNGPIHVSRGVSAGLLLAPMRPVYPPIAISTRTEGVVVIEAIISKLGRIESAHATSGPELLRNAALEAVRNAHYSPYLLNGLPAEVETTITVNFKLAS